MEFNYSKCPECGYVNNNRPDVCPSCGCDLAEYRRELYVKEQAEIKRQEEEAELAEKEEMYLEALHLFTSHEYQPAIVAFLSLGDYKESASYAEKSEIALFESTVVKEFSENPFTSTLYTVDAEKKSNVSDTDLKKCPTDEDEIEKICSEFEKYKGKKYIDAEKYIVACKESLQELERIQLILSEEAPLREKYEEGKKQLAFACDESDWGQELMDGVWSSDESAIEIFEELGEYEDSPILLEQAKRQCLKYGEYLLQQHRYYDAYGKFEVLGNYKNAPELLQEAEKLYVEIERPQIKERERVRKIKEEIAVLEKQMREAKGLFAGSKKKSLQKEIDALKAQI